jgi:TrmH family RNA methyltransferase
MTHRIDSPHNERIKSAAKLRSRRDRKKTGLILIDGVREVQRAVDAGVDFVEVFVHADRESNAELEALHLALIDSGTTVIETAPAAYDKIRYGERDEGIVAIARRPVRRIDDLSLPADPLIVVVDRVEKPGNLGAILRTADGVGAHCVIASDAQGDIFGPNAIRASLGAIFTVPVLESAGSDALEFLVRRNIQIVTATPDGELNYSALSYHGPTAIVVGAEDAGVGDHWKRPPCRRVVLPMRGRIDSLNVSVTAGILLYEAMRQRDRA